MGADAVIVGSATVEACLAGPEALASFLRSLREALDAR
jgi:tryptophan synthase alpha subunit